MLWLNDKGSLFKCVYFSLLRPFHKLLVEAKGKALYCTYQIYIKKDRRCYKRLQHLFQPCEFFQILTVTDCVHSMFVVYPAENINRQHTWTINTLWHLAFTWRHLAKCHYLFKPLLCHILITFITILPSQYTFIMAPLFTDNSIKGRRIASCWYKQKTTLIWIQHNLQSQEQCVNDVICLAIYILDSLSLSPSSRWTSVSWYQNISISGFIGAKNDGGGGDNHNYYMCNAPDKSSQPTNQNRPDALPVGGNEAISKCDR